MLGLEENKELIRRYTHAVFDEGDVDAVDRYLAPDFFNHVTGRSGTEDFKRLAASLRVASGSANVIDLLIAESALVVALMTFSRTLHEELRAFGVVVPAHGPSYTVTHVHITSIGDGQLRARTRVRDDLIMPRQRAVLR